MEKSKPCDRILRLPDVIAATGKSRSAIYADLKTGSFPMPVRIGARAVGWHQNSIHNWILNRPRTRG
jgi:prophage regulatory protein